MWSGRSEKALWKREILKERGGFREARRRPERKAWRQKHKPFHLTVNEVIRKYLCSIYEGQDISVNIK